MILPNAVGGLPLNHNNFNKTTKEWIMCLLMCNRKTTSRPTLPHELMCMIISEALPSNYGLDPIKTISEWCLVLPHLRMCRLMGSTVLHHHHWNGWYPNDWDLYVHVDDKRNVVNSLCHTLSEINHKFNINIISYDTPSEISYSRHFDIVEAGYPYSFETNSWTHFSDDFSQSDDVSKLPAPSQWTFKQIGDESIVRAYFTYGDKVESYIYFRDIRLVKYKQRAKRAGVDLVIKNIDTTEWDELLAFFYLYNNVPEHGRERHTWRITTHSH